MKDLIEFILEIALLILAWKFIMFAAHAIPRIVENGEGSIHIEITNR